MTSLLFRRGGDGVVDYKVLHVPLLSIRCSDVAGSEPTPRC
jgi:hypothetical protein